MEGEEAQERNSRRTPEEELAQLQAELARLQQRVARRGGEATGLEWSGTVVGVQPRIRLMRSFDERQHSYLGFVLRLQGSAGGEEREFTVGIGQAAQRKQEFRAGDRVSGRSHPVAQGAVEAVDSYRASQLKVLERAPAEGAAGPPWRGVPPDLPTYRARGHRRLAARTYSSKCLSCIWGCEMAVELIVDHWNPGQRRTRTETFCYGPKSCALYQAGPPRKVPGRKGMSWTEPDWVDDEATAHRGPDD